MNETPASSPGSFEGSTIRSQLIWAALFPLVLFVLLATLVMTAGMREITLNLTLQRNTALAQIDASHFSDVLHNYQVLLQTVGQEMQSGQPIKELSSFSIRLASFQQGVYLLDNQQRLLASNQGQLELPVQLPAFPPASTFSQAPLLESGSAIIVAVPVEQRGWLLGIISAGDSLGSNNPESLRASQVLYLVSPDGSLLPTRGESKSPYRLEKELQAMQTSNEAGSLQGESPMAGEEVLLSYSPIVGTGWGLLIAEPLSAIQTPALNYQWILVGLLFLGVALSIGMLSLSLGRVIQPISDLARSAGKAIPGSTFNPLPERGPEELRWLIRAFNQMVIRLAEQQNALRQYAQKALLSQEAERQRLSHELHDGTVQDLVGLVQRLELCQNEMESNPAAALHRLDELQVLARQSLEDVRRISNALRPSILQDIGLTAALQALCENLEEQMPGIACSCEIHGDGVRLPPDLELAVFRVAQEALNNVRQHASSSSDVWVILEFGDEQLILSIQDDGPGFQVPDMKTLVRNGHLGLAGMYERAALFGGQIEVVSTPGQGAQIILRVQQGYK